MEWIYPVSLFIYVFLKSTPTCLAANYLITDGNDDLPFHLVFQWTSKSLCNLRALGVLRKRYKDIFPHTSHRRKGILFENACTGGNQAVNGKTYINL